MRVEDCGVGLAGAGGDRIAIALDRGPRGGDRFAEPRLLALGILGGALGRWRERSPQQMGRSDRDSGRCCHPVQDLPGPHAPRGHGQRR